jgi:large-conductance mechanosensitive channel
MEFGKSFTYVFEDDDWVMKLLLAAVIVFIPIIGPLAVAGWGVEITKRAIQKDPEQLPGWGDFINYLIKGLVVILIGFVYMLPVIIVQVCSNSVFFFGQESGEEGLMIIGNFLMACFGCLTFIYSILAVFFIAAAIGRYADTGEFGSAFQFGKVFATVKAAPAPYLMVLVGGFLAGMIAFVGLIACIVGVFLTIAYANAINAHLFGQAYYEAKLALSGNNDLLQEVALDSK